MQKKHKFFKFKASLVIFCIFLVMDDFWPRFPVERRKPTNYSSQQDKRRSWLGIPQKKPINREIHYKSEEFQRGHTDVCNWADLISSSNVPISFGNNSCKKWLGLKDVDFFHSRMNRLWVSGREGFPGSLAVSFLLEDKKHLKEKRYEILPKSDGTRYIMLLTLSRQNEPLILMIDRLGSWIQVQLSIKRGCFKGAIFDGELVCTTSGKYQYQIFDCMAYDGQDVSKLPYYARVENAKRFVQLEYMTQKKDCFEIIIKNTISKKDATDIISGAKCIDYPLDGLILIDIDNPYFGGKDKLLYKWKELKDHTVDFVIRLDQRKDKLYLQFFVVEEKSRLSCVDSVLARDEFLFHLGISVWNLIHDQVVECKFDLDRNEWRPIQIRIDKDIPNNYETYIKTKKNIQENVTVQKLLSFVKHDK